MFNTSQPIPTPLIISLVILVFGCNRRSGQIVQLNREVLDSCVGQYEPAPDTMVTVSREDAHLNIQVNHQAPLPVFPESEDTFLDRKSGTRFTFAKDAAGRVTHLVLDRNGQKAEAKRVSRLPAEDHTQTIVIGEGKLRFLATGTGQPTVILWSGIDVWSKIQHELEKTVQVVSFDRASTNSKATKTDLRTPSEAARELHTALERASLSPPYVLVGHSFGGALVRVFANIYPKEVVGIVLVDPFQEEFVDWLKTHQPENYEKLVSRGRQAYVSDWEGTLRELRVASSFPDIPVVLLSAANRKPQNGDTFEQGIRSTEFAEGSAAIIDAHAAWLSKIPNGKLVKVEGSSHNIPGERPEVVVQSIEEIIRQIKNSKH